MGSAVTPQVDLGSIGLRGLNSFSSLLAAFSADNVTHTAVIQMEQLGSMFLPTGKFADRVPDLLQRCSSIRLDRLALDVGWRKGDSASIMAQSAGGQSIALLSLVLGSIFTPRTLGDVLKGLSQKLLPIEANLASMEQLVNVAEILQKKLAPLGFGNHLAQQTVLVYRLFEQSGFKVPEGILEVLSGETMAELLHCISRALREERSLVRISADYGACYILSTIMMMFPHDTLVTFDGIVITEGTRRPSSIVIELGRGARELVFVPEICLEQANGLRLPIKVSKVLSEQHLNFMHTYRWNGWVTDVMTIDFMRLALEEPGEVLQACCNLLLSIVTSPLLATENSLVRDRLQNVYVLPDYTRNRPYTKISWKSQDSVRNVLTAYRALTAPLGDNAFKRVSECCQVLTGMTPFGRKEDIITSFQDLRHVFDQTTRNVKGICTNPDKDFHDFRSSRLCSCGRCGLWSRLGSVLGGMFWALFIDVAADTVVSQPSFASKWKNEDTKEGFTTRLPIVQRFHGLMDTILGAPSARSIPYNCEAWRYIHESIFALFHDSGLERHDILAFGTGSQTVLPAALVSLKLHADHPVRYVVLQGSLLMQGNSYSTLRSIVKESQYWAEQDICHRDEIVPSSIGVHSSLQITVRERLDHLELRAIARCSNVEVSFDLCQTIPTSFLVRQAAPCSHDPKRALDPSLRKKVFATSVEFSTARKKVVSIAMTKDNPEAQLLCCADENMILAHQCCLDCAYYQLVNDPDTDPGKNMKIIV